MTDPSKVDYYIDNYLKVRAARDAYRKIVKAKEAEYKEALDLIGDVLRGHLQSNGLQNAATPAGTAFLKTVRSATVADTTAFREHVIQNGEYELADFRANVDAVQAYMDEHKGALPAGINFQSFIDVGVQKR
jgi:hypothetical protein